MTEEEEKSPAATDGGGASLESFGVPAELQAHAKTMWMLNIIGLGPLFLIFVEKPGQWQNPWFVWQVRAMIRNTILFMLCYLPGAFFSFKSMGAIGSGKDPTIPFANPGFTPE